MLFYTILRRFKRAHAGKLVSRIRTMNLGFLINVFKFKMKRRFLKYRPDYAQRERLFIKQSLNLNSRLMGKLQAHRSQIVLKEFLFKSDYIQTVSCDVKNFFRRINFIVSEYKVHHSCIKMRLTCLSDVIWQSCINSLNTWFTEKYKGKKLPQLAMEVMCIPD